MIAASDDGGDGILGCSFCSLGLDMPNPRGPPYGTQELRQDREGRNGAL